jgi:hypothetical protein
MEAKVTEDLILICFTEHILTAFEEKCAQENVWAYESENNITMEKMTYYGLLIFLFLQFNNICEDGLIRKLAIVQFSQAVCYVLYPTYCHDLGVCDYRRGMDWRMDL